jgi:hypothetical protein
VTVGRPLAAGQLRRKVLLGSEAIYQILEPDGARVEVEVVKAPGLRPGLRLHFTRQAVLAMDVVGAAEPDTDDPRRVER